MTTLLTAGGRISCRQCEGTSRRTKKRCKAPAARNKSRCRFHGGRKFSGPKTLEGRMRCAAAKTVHGRETRETRTKRSLGSARLAVLEAVGFSIGLMSGGRTRGVKPNRIAEAYPELQALLKMQVKDGNVG